MKITVYALILILVGCSTSSGYIPNSQQLDSSHLPTPNITLSIPKLSNCTDSNDKSIKINSNAPLTVLVHGCDGSAGRFRALAQLYAFHGQQAICYSYNDRSSLADSADELIFAVNELSKVTDNQPITIIGHSMGGLIARKSVEKSSLKPNALKDKNLELVTISAPLSGIQAANHCGIKPLHWLTVGIIPGICWLITGDNWNEITSSSNFIQNPEPLIPSVNSYLKIVTNEENSCRKRSVDGACLKSDYVFDLSEQYHPKIDNYSIVTGVEIEAGHVEIIGNKDVVPRKLLAVLQEYGLISSTPKNRKDALEQLLSFLY